MKQNELELEIYRTDGGWNWKLINIFGADVIISMWGDDYKTPASAKRSALRFAKKHNFEVIE